MSETCVVEVIVYIFNKGEDFDDNESISEEELKAELQSVGFADEDIQMAMKWIEQSEIFLNNLLACAVGSGTHHFFSEDSILGLDMQRELLYLELEGLINASEREAAIFCLEEVGTCSDMEEFYELIYIIFSFPNSYKEEVVRWAAEKLDMIEVPIDELH